MKYFLGILVFLMSSMLPLEGASANLCEVILGGGSQNDFEVRVPGKAVGRVLLLNKNQYSHMLLHDELSPLDFVVIDTFPTELDPFPLAGIISGTPIQAGCHMEMLARMMNIPLLYVQNAQLDPAWKTLSELPGFHTFQFSTQSNKTIIGLDATRAEIKEHLQSRVKPITLNPSERSVHEVLDLEKIAALNKNDFGQKISNLVRATEGNIQKLISSRTIPDVIGLPESIYYRYLETVQVEPGITLSQKISEAVQHFNQEKWSVAQVKIELNKIQNYFEDHEIPEPILDPILESIKNHYGTINLALRFRSSNRVEDSIGAGVYDSVRLPELKNGDRRKKISQAIRTVWKSLYSYRATLIRQAFALDEAYTDMAIEIHPSYDDITANGLASYSHFYDEQILKVLAYPPGFSATSPESNSKPEILYVIKKRNGEFYFSSDGINPLEKNEMKPTILDDQQYLNLLSICDEMYQHWNKDASKVIRLDFEWIMNRNQLDPKSRPMGMIMQVKETALDAFQKNNFLFNQDIPAPVLKKDKAIKRDAKLDALLEGLALQPFSDTVLRNIEQTPQSSLYVLKGQAFYYLELENKRVLLLGTNHYQDVKTIKSFFEKKRLNFRFLEIGRLSVAFEYRHQQLQIMNLLFHHAQGVAESSLIGDEAKKIDPALFLQLIQSIQVPGVIELTNETRIWPMIKNRPDLNRFSRYLGENGKTLGEL